MKHFQSQLKKTRNGERNYFLNERGNCASHKECDNDENNNNQKIYAYMSGMSGNDKFTGRNFGDSSQLTNWILDPGATCHMAPEASDFIPGPLDDMDKHIKISNGHHITEKQKGQVQIKMCNDNGDPFIATLQNVLLAPDLCDRLFYINALINSGHTCLLRKEFFHGVIWSKREKCSYITT